jgi:hypothetical protein
MGDREMHAPYEVHNGSNTMNKQQGRVQRQGRIYRFSIAGTEYAAFIWQQGTQFSGRIDGNPQVPQCTRRTALAVCDALQEWLVMHAAG